MHSQVAGGRTSISRKWVGLYAKVFVDVLPTRFGAGNAVEIIRFSVCRGASTLANTAIRHTTIETTSENGVLSINYSS